MAKPVNCYRVDLVVNAIPWLSVNNGCCFQLLPAARVDRQMATIQASFYASSRPTANYQVTIKGDGQWPGITIQDVNQVKTKQTNCANLQRDLVISLGTE